MSLKDLSHRMAEIRRLVSEQREREESEKEAARLRAEARGQRLEKLRDETLRPFLEGCIRDLGLNDPSFDTTKEWFEIITMERIDPLKGSWPMHHLYTNLITLFFMDPFVPSSEKLSTVIDYTVTIGTRESENIYVFCGRGPSRKAGSARTVERTSYQPVGESYIEAITTEKLEEMIETAMKTLFPDRLVHEWR